MFSVYVLQNTANNKIYVGFSANPEQRWISERSVAFLSKHAEYNNPLYRAIRKYGWDAFTKQIIEEWPTKEEALEAECFWIEFFRSNTKIFGPACGYNLTPGGDNPPSAKGRKFPNRGPRTHSPETRAKLSASLAGHECSAETRAKIGASKIGNKNCVGRVMSPETRAKIGAASRGRKHSAATRERMSIAQTARQGVAANG